MGKSDVFVIPAGLKLELGPDGLVIEHDGDVDVRHPLAQRAALIRSTQGDLAVHVDLNGTSLDAPSGGVQFATHSNVGRVTASTVTARAGLRADRIEAAGADSGGDVTMASAVEVGRVHARRVVFEGGLLRAKVIEASESIHIRKGQITADILIAPVVTLDPSVTGKITVVESHNDLGSIAVRGCLRLTELDDLGGNSAHFMSERGLSPLGPAPVQAAPMQAAPVQAAPEAVAQAPVAPAPVVPPPAPVQAAPPPAPVVVEVTEDISAMGTLIPEVGRARPLGEEQLDTLVEDDEPPPPEDPVHRTIIDALAPIVAAYGDGELPPPIAELQGWVQRKEYDAIREGIANTFLQLNKYHNRQKTPLKPNVTGYFTALNAVVRRIKR